MVDEGRFDEGDFRSAAAERSLVDFTLLRRLLPELEAVVGVVETSLLRPSRLVLERISLLVGVGPASLSLSSSSEGESEADDSYMLGKGAPKGSWKRGSSARGAVSAVGLTMDEDLAGTGSGGALAAVVRAAVGVVRLEEERVDLVDDGRDECRAGEGGAMTLPGASNEGRTGEAKVVAKVVDMAL